MQLSKLNSAIRDADAVKVRFSFGEVQLHRPSLLEALKTHFGGVRTAETGLTVADGYLQFAQPQAVVDGRAADWIAAHPAAIVQGIVDNLDADDDLMDLA